MRYRSCSSCASANILRSGSQGNYRSLPPLLESESMRTKVSQHTADEAPRKARLQKLLPISCSHYVLKTKCRQALESVASLHLFCRHSLRLHLCSSIHQLCLFRLFFFFNVTVFCLFFYDNMNYPSGFFNSFALMFTSTLSFSSAWCSQYIRSHLLLPAGRFLTETIPYYSF